MGVLTVSAATGSIYLNLLFSGDFLEERDIGISVRIADAAGVGIEETVILPKIQYETNAVEVRTILELDQLQSLSRGTLFILLYSKRNPAFKLVGVIQPRSVREKIREIFLSIQPSYVSLWNFARPTPRFSFSPCPQNGL